MASPIELSNLDDIIRDYQAGVSLKQLAEQNSCSRDVLYRLFRSRNIEIRGRSAAEALKWQRMRENPAAIHRQISAAWRARDAQDANIERRILSVYRAGLLSKRAISRQTGTSLGNVSRILRKAGIHDDKRPLRRAQGNVAVYTKASVSPAEIPFSDELVRRNLGFVHQMAIGSRNVDFGFAQERIAVEIVRRHWNDAKSLRRERLEQIFSAGWRLFVVYDPEQAGIAFADVAQQLVAFLDLARTEPSLGGQYGVVGGQGESVPESRFKLHHWPRIPGF